MSTPAVGEAGKTGDWRDMKPVIDQSKCIPAVKNRAACYLCWLYCPEAVINKSIPPYINLEYCKGCGICSQVCPVQAIIMTPEEKNIG